MHPRDITLQALEDAILRAARTLKEMKGGGPSARDTWWPETMLEHDDYGREVRVQYWGNVDEMEAVMYWWLGPKSPLTSEEKRIIWYRCGCGTRTRSWRHVERMHGQISYEYARITYLTALQKLRKWLVSFIYMDMKPENDGYSVDRTPEAIVSFGPK